MRYARSFVMRWDDRSRLLLPIGWATVATVVGAPFNDLIEFAVILEFAISWLTAVFGARHAINFRIIELVEAEQRQRHFCAISMRQILGHYTSINLQYHWNCVCAQVGHQLIRLLLCQFKTRQTNKLNGMDSIHFGLHLRWAIGPSQSKMHILKMCVHWPPRIGHLILIILISLREYCLFQIRTIERNANPHSHCRTYCTTTPASPAHVWVNILNTNETFPNFPMRTITITHVSVRSHQTKLNEIYHIRPFRSLSLFLSFSPFLCSKRMLRMRPVESKNVHAIVGVRIIITSFSIFALVCWTFGPVEFWIFCTSFCFRWLWSLSWYSSNRVEHTLPLSSLFLLFCLDL